MSNMTFPANRFQIVLRVQIWTFLLRNFVNVNLVKILCFSCTKVTHNGRLCSKTGSESAQGGKGMSIFKCTLVKLVMFSLQKFVRILILYEFSMI